MGNVKITPFIPEREEKGVIEGQVIGNSKQKFGTLYVRRG
jgi:hypothetical protein